MPEYKLDEFGEYGNLINDESETDSVEAILTPEQDAERWNRLEKEMEELEEEDRRLNKEMGINSSTIKSDEESKEETDYDLGF